MSKIVIITYNVLAYLLDPALELLFWIRLLRGKEVKERRSERKGYASVNRPQGPVIWVHAASVGEFMAAQPILKWLGNSGYSVLLTTMTTSSARLSSKQHLTGVIHQFLPYDTPQRISRFLKYWRPSLVILMESEIWPTLIQSAHYSGIPVIVANARISDRSFKKWLLARRTSRSLMRIPELFIAQYKIDQDRLKTLGAKKVILAGNLKFEVNNQSIDQATRTRLENQIASRQVVVFASTHAAEEELLLDVAAQLKLSSPTIMFVIAPRHPNRAEPIEKCAANKGLRSLRLTSQQAISKNTDLLVFDTIGDMQLAYSLAKVVFLGNSIHDKGGGQNPIEPLRMGASIIHGPYVSNFNTIYRYMDMEGAAIVAVNKQELINAIESMLQLPDDNESMNILANKVLEHFSGSLDRTVEAITPYLPGFVQTRQEDRRSTANDDAGDGVIH